MSVDQLITLLKSIPASRVKNVDVMYNAPAKYNIKDAVINVILDKGVTDGKALQGEVGADYLLKPYEGQFLYILKQKYTFVIFAQYEPDYFAQLPYQNATELKIVFRFENMDYNLVAGVGAVIPFRIGEFMNSQFTAQGIRIRQKLDHFNEISFNNSKYLGQFFLNNTFTLSQSHSNLKLDRMDII